MLNVENTTSESERKAEMERKYGFTTVVEGILGSTTYHVVRQNTTGFMYVVGEGGAFTMLIGQDGRPMKFTN